MTSKMWRDRWVNNLIWPCPACRTGQLLKDTFHDLPSLEERTSRQEPYHEEYVTRFSGLMQCSTAHCKEVATITGDKLEQVETRYVHELGEEQDVNFTYY